MLWLIIPLCLAVVCLLVLAAHTLILHRKSAYEHLPQEERRRLYAQEINAFQKRKIPLRIVQTCIYPYALLPERMRSTCEDLKQMNPEFEHVYMDDVEMRDWLVTYMNDCVDTFDQLRPGAFRADFFRYCYLYQEGGLYLDMGFRSAKPLKEFLTACTFLSAEDIKDRENTSVGRFRHSLYQAVLGCIPKHPVLKECIHLIKQYVKQRDARGYQLEVTGPHLIGSVFHDLTGLPVCEGSWGDVLIFYNHIDCITYQGEVILHSKYYYGYREDLEAMQWRKEPHYSSLYQQGKTFQSLTQGRALAARQRAYRESLLRQVQK